VSELCVWTAGILTCFVRMDEDTAPAPWEVPDLDWDDLERILSELALTDMVRNFSSSV
jgi:hypothetical protein